MISCPSREERHKLIELLQKQIRSPAAAGVASPTSSTVPYVSRPPFRLLTRHLARLIKMGHLTRLVLTEILGGGEGECQRRLILGCALIDGRVHYPSDRTVSTTSIDLSRFRRRCVTEVHLSDAHSHSLRAEETNSSIPTGGPFFIRSWSQSDSSSSASTQRRCRNHSDFWTRGGSLDAARCLSSCSPQPAPFRARSLPPVEISFLPPADPPAEQPITIQHASTVIGTWVSRFSFDSNLSDGEATCSSNEEPVYRSTLYAHWWRKAKFPLVAPMPPPSSRIPGRCLIFLDCRVLFFSFSLLSLFFFLFSPFA